MIKIAFFDVDGTLLDFKTKSVYNIIEDKQSSMGGCSYENTSNGIYLCHWQL